MDCCSPRSPHARSTSRIRSTATRCRLRRASAHRKVHVALALIWIRDSGMAAIRHDTHLHRYRRNAQVQRQRWKRGLQARFPQRTGLSNELSRAIPHSLSTTNCMDSYRFSQAMPSLSPSRALFASYRASSKTGIFPKGLSSPDTMSPVTPTLATPPG
jgi:hypothetical protein